MTILYKNEAVKKQFCSEYKKKWRYPEQVKVKLEAAENYIKHSDSYLAMMMMMKMKLLMEI